MNSDQCPERYIYLFFNSRNQTLQNNKYYDLLYLRNEIIQKAKRDMISCSYYIESIHQQLLEALKILESGDITYRKYSRRR
jgi:hypothetical protein